MGEHNVNRSESAPNARFEDGRYYRPGDAALSVIASRGTLATWRWQGRGPPLHQVRSSHSIFGRRSQCVAGCARGRTDDPDSRGWGDAARGPLLVRRRGERMAGPVAVTDWVAVMGDVAVALLGEPERGTLE